MEALLDNANDTAGDDTPTRHSSKLSLGSSPSVLSEDEEDGDKYDPSGNSNYPGVDHATTTFCDQKQDGKDDQDASTHGDDMNHLFDVAPSTNNDLDDIHLEHDSASPLSSVPDDFPLSPDPLLLSPPTHEPPPPMTRRQKQQLQAETRSPQEETDEKGAQDETTTTSFIKPNRNKYRRKRKRRARNKGGQYQSSNPNKRPSINNDKNKVEGDSIDQDLSQQTSKSRRVSIHGRSICNKSTLGTNVEEETNDEDDTKMDEMTSSGNKQTPLGPTNHHNHTTGTPASSPESKTIIQQHGSSDNSQQETDDNNNNNEEKENTPVISNKNNNGATIRNDFSPVKNTMLTTCLENFENLPNNEEDRDDQQQHKEAFDALTHIEVEFARLRDKLYQEKMAELNEEAVMIANGTHPSLVILMTEIEEKKDRRISMAEAWRKYQHDNFKRQFEGFEYQANVHFISRKSSMRRKILAEMNGKRWRLEDEQGKLYDPSHKHGNPIPDTNALMIRKQAKREDTMDLQDIKDAVGFPKAPQVAGLSPNDIRSDLLSLGLETPGSH